jgi:radical SAM protein with 4Fe4S-binding SPASM domain
VEYAKKKRFNVSLMTSGTIGIDESVVGKLADSGLHAVDLSLYSGESEVHDSVTRVPGSFDKTLKTVELFKARGIRVRLKCPIMKTNVGAYRSVKTLAESYGVDWGFDPNLTAGKDGDKGPTYLRISDDELKEHIIFVMGMSKEDERKKAAELSDPACDDLYSGSPCGASQSSCYISPYGDVQPCIEITMICGNLREKPFREIWEGSEVMLMVRGIKKKDLRKCPDCPEINYCHRCMGQAYVENGDLLAPSEGFCRTVKMRRRVQEEARQNG